MAVAQPDMPACQNGIVSGAKCHFAGLDCTSAFFFDGDGHWIDLQNYQLEAHLHTISIHLKQSPGGLLEINKKMEHFACCQLQL